MACGMYCCLSRSQEGGSELTKLQLGKSPPAWNQTHMPTVGQSGDKVLSPSRLGEDLAPSLNSIPPHSHSHTQPSYNAAYHPHGAPDVYSTIVFVSMKLFTACSPRSLPMPDIFSPPQGRWQKHG
mmetsp:Transcript_16291/g.41771  ORF Transcript_16291/g.41771 Transcript_16291/m.41771 type:complete len:125 (-) Transcript_16291:313-687(-)